MITKRRIPCPTPTGNTSRGAAARQFAAPQNNQQQNQQLPPDSG